MFDPALKVIIFEDNEAIRKGMQLLLQNRGYEVRTYADPTLCPVYADPTCTCPANKPCADILLTDNSMPHMSGLEFIALQADKGCKGANNFKGVMSASWTAADLQEAKRLGCQIFSKPLDLKMILDWVEACHRQIRALRQPAASQANHPDSER